MNIEHGKFYIEIPNVAVSEKIQLALFKRGFKWNSGNTDVKFTEHKFLCLDDKNITFGDDENYLKRRDYKKISVNGISRGYAYEY